MINIIEIGVCILMGTAVMWGIGVLAIYIAGAIFDEMN